MAWEVSHSEDPDGRIHLSEHFFAHSVQIPQESQHGAVERRTLLHPQLLKEKGGESSGFQGLHLPVQFTPSEKLRPRILGHAQGQGVKEWLLLHEAGRQEIVHRWGTQVGMCKWGTQVGCTGGVPRWDSQVGCTGGVHRWSAQVGCTGGVHR